MRLTPPSATAFFIAQPKSAALCLIRSPSSVAISLFTACSTADDVTIWSRRAQSLTTIPILRTLVISTVFLGWSECIGHAAMGTPMDMLSMHEFHPQTQTNFCSLLSRPPRQTFVAGFGGAAIADVDGVERSEGPLFLLPTDFFPGEELKKGAFQGSACVVNPAGIGFQEIVLGLEERLELGAETSVEGREVSEEVGVDGEGLPHLLPNEEENGEGGDAVEDVRLRIGNPRRVLNHRPH
nr:hypothetical protein CR513_55797 [Ipomoea batatas]